MYEEAEVTGHNGLQLAALEIDVQPWGNNEATHDTAANDTDLSWQQIVPSSNVIYDVPHSDENSDALPEVRDETLVQSAGSEYVIQEDFQLPNDDTSSSILNETSQQTEPNTFPAAPVNHYSDADQEDTRLARTSFDEPDTVMSDLVGTTRGDVLCADEILTGQAEEVCKRANPSEAQSAEQDSVETQNAEAASEADTTKKSQTRANKFGENSADRGEKESENCAPFLDLAEVLTEDLVDAPPHAERDVLEQGKSRDAKRRTEHTEDSDDEVERDRKRTFQDSHADGQNKMSSTEEEAGVQPLSSAPDSQDRVLNSVVPLKRSSSVSEPADTGDTVLNPEALEEETNDVISENCVNSDHEPVPAAAPVESVSSITDAPAIPNEVAPTEEDVRVELLGATEPRVNYEDMIASPRELELNEQFVHWPSGDRLHGREKQRRLSEQSIEAEEFLFTARHVGTNDHLGPARERDRNVSGVTDEEGRGRSATPRRLSVRLPHSRRSRSLSPRALQYAQSKTDEEYKIADAQSSQNRENLNDAATQTDSRSRSPKTSTSLISQEEAAPERGLSADSAKGNTESTHTAVFDVVKKTTETQTEDKENLQDASLEIEDDQQAREVTLADWKKEESHSVKTQTEIAQEGDCEERQETTPPEDNEIPADEITIADTTSESEPLEESRSGMAMATRGNPEEQGTEGMKTSKVEMKSDFEDVLREEQRKKLGTADSSDDETEGTPWGESQEWSNKSASVQTEDLGENSTALWPCTSVSVQTSEAEPLDLQQLPCAEQQNSVEELEGSEDSYSTDSFHSTRDSSNSSSDSEEKRPSQEAPPLNLTQEAKAPVKANFLSFGTQTSVEPTVERSSTLDAGSTEEGNELTEDGQVELDGRLRPHLFTWESRSFQTRTIETQTYPNLRVIETQTSVEPLVNNTATQTEVAQTQTDRLAVQENEPENRHFFGTNENETNTRENLSEILSDTQAEEQPSSELIEEERKHKLDSLHPNADDLTTNSSADTTGYEDHTGKAKRTENLEKSQDEEVAQNSLETTGGSEALDNSLPVNASDYDIPSNESSNLSTYGVHVSVTSSEDSNLDHSSLVCSANFKAPTAELISDSPSPEHETEKEAPPVLQMPDQEDLLQTEGAVGHPHSSVPDDSRDPTAIVEDVILAQSAGRHTENEPALHEHSAVDTYQGRVATENHDGHENSAPEPGEIDTSVLAPVVRTASDTDSADGVLLSAPTGNESDAFDTELDSAIESDSGPPVPIATSSPVKNPKLAKRLAPSDRVEHPELEAESAGVNSDSEGDMAEALKEESVDPASGITQERPVLEELITKESKPEVLSRIENERILPSEETRALSEVVSREATELRNRSPGTVLRKDEASSESSPNKLRSFASDFNVATAGRETLALPVNSDPDVSRGSSASDWTQTEEAWSRVDARPAAMAESGTDPDADANDALDELERLRRERQRILDMLAQDIMPSKLQVRPSPLKK